MCQPVTHVSIKEHYIYTKQQLADCKVMPCSFQVNLGSSKWCNARLYFNLVGISGLLIVPGHSSGLCRFISADISDTTLRLRIPAVSSPRESTPWSQWIRASEYFVNALKNRVKFNLDCKSLTTFPGKWVLMHTHPSACMHSTTKPNI